MIRQLQHSDQSLKDVFMMNAQNLGCDDLRGVLDGMRNRPEASIFPREQTIDSFLSEVASHFSILILSPKPEQISEFVQYITGSYQLASEAYNFVLLPFSMNSKARASNE